jgi:cytochrome c-type biogenesis protein CcmH
MTLWFILTIMTSVAAVLVSAPFIRRLDRRQSDTSGNVAVYIDQLKEVESEAAQGLIDPVQAESASAEIKRRLLAADKSDDAASILLTSGERTFAAIGVSGIVVFGSIGLFALTANLEPPTAGSFASSDRTVAGSAEPPASEGVAALAPPTRSTPQPAAGMPRTQVRSNLPPVEEMIQRLVTRLQRNPKDAEGWRMLGWSYFSIEQFTEAAAAYARAIELNSNVAAYHSGRAEALIKAASGVVTADAKVALDEALKLDSKDTRARFFKGLAKEQAGDKAAALRDWTELLSAMEPTEPLASELKQRVTSLAKQVDGGVDPTNAPSAAVASASQAPKTAEASPHIVQEERGPGPEDIARAEAASPTDRAAMIRGMVDGLASRLEQSPHDAEGWIKLIRSRSVLGETDKAKQALERALKIFSDETTERERIAAAGRQLGLSP